MGRYPHFSVVLVGRQFGVKLIKMIQNGPSKTSPNGAKTKPEPPQTIPKRPATTPHASHATTHTSTAAMGWENARHGWRAAGDGGAFSHPMAAVEVCVVAWLAWRVVAGLLGVGGLGWFRAEVVVPGEHAGDELVWGTHLAGSKYPWWLFLALLEAREAAR